MDEFDKAIDCLLVTTDQREVFKTLMIIRNHLEGPLPKVKDAIKKIQEKDCLKVLTSCLQQRRHHIINVSLSILGRCCMERNFVRISVNRYNLVCHLNSILKRHDINSIRVRLFRVIGNMCQHWDRFTNTIIEKEPNLHLVERIVNFLKVSSPVYLKNESEISEGCFAIMSAIRALRELANKETVGRLVELGVLNAAGVVLIHGTPEWSERKKYMDILLATVKLIYSYSKYRDRKSITELQAAQGGDAMVCLGKMVELCPTLVSRIIMNLMYVVKSKSDLPMATISECLIKRLENPSAFPNGYEDKNYRENLKCLCYFIQCLLINETGLVRTVIPALLSILDRFRDMSDVTLKNSTLIIASLSVYISSSNLLLFMLQNGITHIFMRKLDWVLGPNPIYNGQHECLSKPYGGHNVPRNLVWKMIFGNKLPLIDLSFDRASSPYCESLLSSGSQSPWSSPNISEREVTESDSDDYSPVCSDVECELQPTEDLDPPHSPHIDESDELSSLAGSTLADKSTSLLKKEMVIKIVNLVQHFQILRPAPMELINPPDFLLKLLMLCIPVNKPFRGVDPISSVKLIARRPEYLISLMQSNFFLTVYKMTMHIHESCCTCDELYKIGRDILKAVTVTVEHRCGKGDIAHQLYRGTDSVKGRIVPVIPLIVNNTQVLNQLMQIGGGLEILLELMQKDDLQANSIFSLSCLSKKLGIVYPKSNKDGQKIPIPLRVDLTDCTLSDDSSIVFFKLDDGSIIHADRELLCQKSVYFNQMLSGTFKEANEHEICLHNVSNHSLKLLFFLMRLDLDPNAVYAFDVDLSVLLDAIILTDRYLLEDYCSHLTGCVQTFKFAPRFIPIIYNWSLESCTNILRMEAVTYSLVANIREDCRRGIFKHILNTKEAQMFINDISELLRRQFKLI